ncbi:MAG: hypothetical protein LUO89_09225 [Methanothrix sp.]|nr:hypothetical protein [Methanothrix sp.]
MNLITTYQGGRDPFEGDLRLLLHSLPEGARVTQATVSLKPSKAPTSPALFREVFAFENPAEGDFSAKDWGLERSPDPGPGESVEVNFHARRTLAGVRGSGGKATLQVDMGGALVGIAEDGTFLTPNKKPKTVDLSTGLNALPGLTVDRFVFFRELTGGQISIGKVEIRSVPTNVSLRLDKMPPFWTHVGEMATAQSTSDFAAVLNAFLVDATAIDGFYVIPLIVHSDAISRLDVTVSIDFVIIRPIMPSYLPEAVMSYGYSSLPGVSDDLMTVVLPSGAIPVKGTGGTLSGTFDDSRVLFGAIGDQDTIGTVVVSPGRTLAQPVQMQGETPATGIDLPLSNTAPGLAGLNLAIQEDADGKPSGVILQSAGISVEKPVPGGSSWGSAKLPSEFRFLKGVRYWLVVQSVSGDAYWDVENASDDTIHLQASADGGFSWRVASALGGDKPLQAIFRLRYSPERFSVPVQLQIGRGKDAVRVGFNRFSPLGRVQFDADFSSELGVYLESTSIESPCGKRDLLTNGDFERPPFDDATRKIFGFDERVATTSTGTVETGALVVGEIGLPQRLNMRVQRFITLSIDGGDVTRIDCAGAIPERTIPEEIVSAINRAVAGKAEASLVAVEGSDKKAMMIRSLKMGAESSVQLYCWCTRGPPDLWQGSPGVVKVRGPGGISVALAAPLPLIAELNPEFSPLCLGGDGSDEGSRSPEVLSQGFEASGGCAYILRFTFVAIRMKKKRPECLILSTLGNKRMEKPSWEVLWQDGSGRTIETQSEIIPPPEDAVPIGDWQYLYESRLVAPPGTVKAEVHFVQPKPGILVLEEASIFPASSALSNGRFIEWTTGQGETPTSPVPVGWEYQGIIDRATTASGAVSPGALLSGDEDAFLTQAAQVRPGERYTLNIRSQPDPFAQDGDPRPAEARPRIEIHWMKGGLPIGDAAVLVLDGRGFWDRSWSGAAPVGSESAEIRIIRPAGAGRLRIESVALQRVEMVSVPLTFLSEAPGELKVSNLTVAYDLPEPMEPEVPMVDAATLKS